MSSAEFVQPPDMSEGLILFHGFKSYVSDQQLVPQDFNDTNRLHFSRTTAHFLHDDMDAINQARRERQLLPYPTLTQDLVDISLRDISLEMQAAPARRREIASSYLASAVREQHAYTFQVSRVTRLGETMRELEHPLAGCALDVLLAYGKSVATMAKIIHTGYFSYIKGERYYGL